jgi:hypothetical protein
VLTCDLSGLCLAKQGFEVGLSVGKILLLIVVGDNESDDVRGIPGILYIL